MGESDRRSVGARAPMPPGFIVATAHCGRGTESCTLRILRMLLLVLTGRMGEKREKGGAPPPCSQAGATHPCTRGRTSPARYASCGCFYWCSREEKGGDGDEAGWRLLSSRDLSWPWPTAAMERSILRLLRRQGLSWPPAHCGRGCIFLLNGCYFSNSLWKNSWEYAKLFP